MAFVREPLVHFVLLALALYVATDQESAPLIVDPEFAEANSALDHREPAERTEAYIREELLVREARRLGLDRGDPIVRRRLAMKMEALIVADVVDPSEEELQAYLNAHADEFAQAARFSFRHVFYAARRADPLGDARRGADGDSFLMGDRVHAQDVHALAGRFGSDFGEGIRALHNAGQLENGAVVESRFGAHRLMEVEILAGGTPSLDEVRARVHQGLREARERETLNTALEELERNTVIER